MTAGTGEQGVHLVQELIQSINRLADSNNRVAQELRQMSESNTEMLELMDSQTEVHAGLTYSLGTFHEFIEELADRVQYVDGVQALIREAGRIMRELSDSN